MWSPCKVNWDDLGAFQQAKVLAYHQIAEYDERELQIAMAGGVSKGKVTKGK